MKYHIVVKFLAVMLCALFLLVSLGSAAGILLLASQGLYASSVDTMLEQTQTDALRGYAEFVGQRYASVNLGGCPEELLDILDGWMEEDFLSNRFRPGSVGYRILDAEGNALEGQPLDACSQTLSFPVSGTYRVLVALQTEEQYNRRDTSVMDQNAMLYNAIPAQGAPVANARFYDESGRELVSTTETGVSALAFYSLEGNVLLRTTEVMELMLPETVVAGASFFDGTGGMLYQTFSREGVGTIWVDAEGYLCFAAYQTDGQSTPAISPEGAEVYGISLGYGDDRSEGISGVDPLGVLVRMEDGRLLFEAPAGSGFSQLQDEPVTSVTFLGKDGTEILQSSDGIVTMEEGGFRWESRESAAQEETLPEAQEETLPAAEEATMPAAPSRRPNTYSYYDSGYGNVMVAEFLDEPVQGLTVELMLQDPVMNYPEYVDAVRLVWSYRYALFGILAVNLLLFAVSAVYLCCAAGRKPGSDEIKAMGLNRIPLDGYAAAVALIDLGIAWLLAEGLNELIRQGIYFAGGAAAAAGYAACLLFVAFCFAFAAQTKMPGGYWWRNSLCGLSLRLCAAVCRFTFRCLAWCWRKGLPLIGRILRAAWKLVRFFWLELVRLLKWLADGIRRCASRIGKIVGKLYGRLPLIWQWLAVGLVLLLWLFAAVLGRSESWLILWFCAGVGIVLYGAHCFGTLMESARRMRGGDLDTKVDDGLLVGCFRQFAQELNGLADVAVIAAQKQLKSERMKTELITNVSHDIKTPLTSIINYVDLMSKPHTPEEQELYLEVLARQSQRLKKLVDDLMEMSKASSGNIAVNIAQVDASEAVNQALGEFGDKLEKVNLVAVVRHPEEPVAMLADGRLVWRVMSNVLSNAVKYALPGTRLYVDISTLEDKVLISLKNISREELNVEADELMERFVRGDTSRNTEGSGLGLNIAKSLMELQKGQLQLLVDGDLFKATLIFPGV